MTRPRNLTLLAFLEGQAQCLINGLSGLSTIKVDEHWLQIMHFLVRTPLGFNPHFSAWSQSRYKWNWGFGFGWVFWIQHCPFVYVRASWVSNRSCTICSFWLTMLEFTFVLVFVEEIWSADKRLQPWNASWCESGLLRLFWVPRVWHQARCHCSKSGEAIRSDNMARTVIGRRIAYRANGDSCTWYFSYQQGLSSRDFALMRSSVKQMSGLTTIEYVWQRCFLPGSQELKALLSSSPAKRKEAFRHGLEGSAWDPLQWYHFLTGHTAIHLKKTVIKMFFDALSTGHKSSLWPCITKGHCGFSFWISGWRRITIRSVDACTYLEKSKPPIGCSETTLWFHKYPTEAIRPLPGIGL